MKKFWQLIFKGVNENIYGKLYGTITFISPINDIVMVCAGTEIVGVIDVLNNKVKVNKHVTFAEFDTINKFLKGELN